VVAGAVAVWAAVVAGAVAVVAGAVAAVVGAGAVVVCAAEVTAVVTGAVAAWTVEVTPGRRSAEAVAGPAMQTRTRAARTAVKRRAGTDR
jgi:hypothetical protein